MQIRKNICIKCCLEGKLKDRSIESCIHFNDNFTNFISFGLFIFKLAQNKSNLNKPHPWNGRNNLKHSCWSIFQPGLDLQEP